MMQGLFSVYGLRARLYPALLCVPPFLVLKHFAVDPFVDPSLLGKLFVSLAGDASMTLVLLYLLIQASRLVSKILFEDRSVFPTTLMLLPSSARISPEFRSQLATKIKDHFSLELPIDEHEMNDPDATRVRIQEIVSLIVGRVGDGKLLLQHNIEYGFVRNLSGGAVLG